jgi:fibronectin-binding autotransporter adhesin
VKTNRKFAVFLAALGCTALTASAASFYWDGTANVALSSSDNTNTVSQAWLSGGLWDNGTTSAALASWTLGDSAIFGGSAASQTVTLGSTITVGNLSFGSGANGSGTSGTAYTISGGTLTLNGTALTANTATVITSAISNAVTASISGAGAVTFRGNISGAGILTHSGAGLLTLSAIDAGRDNYNALSGAGSIRVGASAASFYGLHGSLSGLTGTVTVAGLVYNRASALGSATAAFSQEAGSVWLFSNDDLANLNVTYQMGSLSGSGTLTGTGYSAARTGIKTLSIGALNTDTTYSGTIGNTFSGGGGTVALTKVGTGKLTLAGGNSYTSGTTLSTGTIVATNGNALGTGGTVTVNDAGTGSNNTSLLLGSVTMGRAITVANQGSGTTTLGANGSVANPEFFGAITLAKNVTLDGSTNTDRLTFTGGIGGTGNVTIGGSTGRVMFLTSANTFNGSLTINSASTLQLHWGGAANNTSYIPDASSVTANGTFTLAKGGGSETIDALLGSGTVRSLAGNDTLVVGGNGGSGTFSGGIIEAGGSLAITKSGAGTQTISGTNTYTGATSINGGTLSLGTTGSIANSTAITVASAANFDVSGLSGGFTLGGGKTLKGEGTVTGNVSDDVDGVAIITAGNGTSGTLTINGNLTFNGSGDVNIGTLSNYTSATALAVTGDFTASGAPGDVFINLPSTPVGPGIYHLISHANVLTDLSSFTLNTQPTLSARQVGNLVNNAGSIDYVVAGANPVWTGALGSSWTTATLTAPKNWTLPGGGITDYLEGDVVLFDDTATGSTTVNLEVDVSLISAEFFNSSKNYTLQSSGGFGITGPTMLLKSGTGILTISNANTHSGATSLSAGITRIGNDSALGTGDLTLNGGTLSSDSATARTPANASLTIGADLTLGDAVNSGALTFSSAVDLGATTRVLTTESAVTLAGSITNGSLSKTGPGTLTLSGTNSYGATVINSGTLKLGDGGATGSAGTGTITNNAALVVDRSGTPSIVSVINGTGSLTVNGGGTLSLSAKNTYTGTTTINGSVLNLTMGLSYAPSKVGSSVVINSGGSLVLNAYFQTGFAYNLAGNVAPANITINAGGSFNKNNQATYIENLTMNGNGAVIGSGANAGDNLQLCANVTATSTAAGAPTISGMNLVAGAYTDAGNTRTIDVTHGAGSTSTDDLTIGVIGQQTPGDAASMIKTGAGTLKLTGVNTYAGTTTVSQGTLKGATSFAGTLVVQSGTTLAPGDGIGTLGAGATTLAGTYVCEVDATTADVLAVTGALDLTGASLELSGTPAAASYTIATYTGALTSTFTASPALPSGYSLDYATPGVIKLVSAAGFTSWIDGFTFAPGADKTPSGDPDGDGVSNLVEYALAGFNPTLPDGATGNFNGNLLSFTKRTEAAADGKISYAIQESDDLGATDVWTEVGSYTSNNTTTISFTLPTGKAKTFARLVVTQLP